MKNLRAASVQFEHTPNDKAANLAKVRTFAEAAFHHGVNILSFPECCITGYWHLRHLNRSELEALAERVPEGPSSQALIEMAVRFRMVIGAGLIEIAEDGRLFNTYVVATPEGTASRHRKIHAFVSQYLTSGSDFTVFDLSQGWRVGVLTCYDNNIIENGRIMALMGVDLLMAPHQTGGCASNDPNIMGKIDRSIWDRRETDPASIEAELKGPKGRGWLMRWLPSRAHDGGYFLLFSNGIGVDDDEIRTGNAMIIDPYGRVLEETWKAGDDMVISDLDASLLIENTGRRWILTRRPELYRILQERTGKEVDTRVIRFDHKGV
jgi:predicted amidohydrolase